MQEHETDEQYEDLNADCSTGAVSSQVDECWFTASPGPSLFSGHPLLDEGNEALLAAIKVSLKYC